MRFLHILIASTSFLLLSGGCSSSPDPDGQADLQSGATGGSSGGSGGNPAGGVSSGGNLNSGSGGAGAGGAGGSGAGSSPSTGGLEGRPELPMNISFEYDPEKDSPAATCAIQRITAAPLPLDMYVVLDRSGSMRNPASDPDLTDCDVNLSGDPIYSSKWCLAVNALGKYFASSDADGFRASLQFMPPGNRVDPNECGPGALNPHSTPTVDLIDLPEPVGAIDGLIFRLNEAVPNPGQTEIESALNGIADYTAANRVPDRKMIGVLVTDGAPTGNCEEDVSVLAQIPTNHFSETGIPTFLIGMTGAPYQPLEQMAEGAGSPEHAQFCDAEDPNTSCHYWSVGDGDPEAFSAALDAIGESVVGCAFSVPSSQDGLVDIDTVTVDFKADNQSSAVSLTRVAELSTCGSDGFYTEEQGDLAVIKLCPSVCEQVNLESEVGVELLCEGQ